MNYLLPITTSSGNTVTRVFAHVCNQSGYYQMSSCCFLDGGLPTASLVILDRDRSSYVETVLNT